MVWIVKGNWDTGRAGSHLFEEAHAEKDWVATSVLFVAETETVSLHTKKREIFDESGESVANRRERVFRRRLCAEVISYAGLS